MKDEGGDGPPTTLPEDLRSHGSDRSRSPAPIRWVRRSGRALVALSRDVVFTIVVLLAAVALVVAVSGVWPPLVAIESGSMEPNMKQGDLVLLAETDRYSHGQADEMGILSRSAAEGTDHDRFGEPGTVIVFAPNGGDGTPIIHRVAFHVQAGENWFERADSRYVGDASNCAELRHCPAPHDGYVTKGDANPHYDQASPTYTVVRAEWVTGKAVARVPYVGCLRIEFASERSCLE